MKRLRKIALSLWLSLWTIWCAAALLTDGMPLLGPLALTAGAVWLGFTRRWQLVLLFCLGTTMWWFGIEPRKDRNWKPEYMRQPTATVNGDEVLIRDLRNFEFRTEDDFDANWVERRVHLSSLRSVDIVVSHWGNPWIAHALLSFDFGPEGYLTASVETRQEAGEYYSALRGFFRQYELIYLLADEADVIRLRTNARTDEMVRLYRTKMTPEDSRALFLSYLEWMNANAQNAEWYNALTNNCTSRYSAWLLDHKIGGISHWDWRLILNGKGDRMLYDKGLLETEGLSFDALRQRALLPRDSVREGFSVKIREGRREFTAMGGLK